MPGVKIIVTAEAATAIKALADLGTQGQAALNALGAGAERAAAAWTAAATSVNTVARRIEASLGLIGRSAKVTESALLNASQAQAAGLQLYANRLRASGRINDVYFTNLGRVAAAAGVALGQTTGSVAAYGTSLARSGVSTVALRAAVGSLATTATLFASAGLQRIAWPLMLLGRELKQVAQAMHLTRASIAPAGLAVAGITTAVWTGIQAWKAYKAILAETQAQLALAATQKNFADRTFEILLKVREQGKITEAEFLRLFEALDRPGGTRLVQVRLREIVGTAEQEAAMEKLFGLNEKMHLETLTGFEKEREASAQKYREEMNLLKELGGLTRTETEKRMKRDREADAFTAKRMRDADIERREQEEITAAVKKTADAKTDAHLQLLDDIDELDARVEKNARDRAALEEFIEGVRLAALSVTDPSAALDEEERLAKQQADLRLQDVADHEQAEALKALITAQYAAKRLQVEKDRAEAEKAIRQRIEDSVVSMMGSAATAAKLFGREGFIAYKALSIAQATIAAVLSVQRALAEVPYPANIFVAAAAAAAGAVNVAQIASTTYAAGGRPEVGAPAIIGERGPELWIPDRAGLIIPNHRIAEFSSGRSLAGPAGRDESPRELRQNLNVFMDRRAWLDASRDDIEAIALEAGRKHFVRL